ncbi:MAG: type I secretion system permease/ATPase [Desulfofustis sp.]|nr:type I secretion system permease/ATPase [Desulfofustis sp.]
MTAATDSRAETTWKIKNVSDTVDDPIADCLVMLSRIYGQPISRTALRAGLPLENNRLSIHLTARAAARAGLSSRVLSRTIKQTSTLELPCILLLNPDKACVLTDIDFDDQTLTILLPETGMGKETVPIETIEQIYSGYAIFVHPSFDRIRDTSGIDRPRQKSWFWGKMLDSWRIYRDVLIASFLINTLGLATPFFILNVYDRVIPNSAFETLWVLAIGIAIVYFFSLLMQSLRGYFVDLAGSKASLNMSAELIEKTLGMKMTARPESVGSFSTKIQQFDSIRDFITSFSITAMVDMPFVVLALLVIWYLAGPIVLVHIVAIIILIMYSLMIHRPLKLAIENTYQATSQKNAILVEGLNGLENLKMLGAESKVQKDWEDSISQISRWGSRSRFLSTSVNHIASFVQNGTVVAVVIAGVYAISEGYLTQGGLIAIVILTRQAIAPMTQFVGLLARYHRARTAYLTLKKMMMMPVERPPESTFLHRATLRGDVEFKNVSFRYPDQHIHALKNVSFSVKAGEHVGVIGSIGSGKSTLSKILLGLYEPESGMVTVDGTDTRQIDPHDLRFFIGCVPQDITLFRGSVRENIIIGHPDVDDEAILRAAELAGVTEIVKKHTAGFDMPVGEQGRSLSGGQRQTVALARALLHDPPILILDEPSSSMDARTERRLCSQLRTILEGKTLLLITHRASLLALVDRVIVLDNGSVRADGPKDNILEAIQRGQLSL